MKLGTLCYLRDNGKTLMLHRVKKENDMHHDKWVGLGGKIEPGETPEECIIREVKEESGFTIKNPVYKGIFTLPKFFGNEWKVFVFVANDYTGEIIDSNEGNLSWIEDHKLKDLDLQESDYMLIDWLDKRETFSAKFIFDDKKLLSHNVVFHG